jgi:hypothetical protein
MASKNDDPAFSKSASVVGSVWLPFFILSFSESFFSLESELQEQGKKR